MANKYDHGVIAGHLLDGRSYKWICDKIGCPIGTVQQVKRKIDKGKVDPSTIVSDIPRIGHMRSIPREDFEAQWHPDYFKASVAESLEIIKEASKPELKRMIMESDNEGIRIKAMAELRATMQWEASLIGAPKSNETRGSGEDDMDEMSDEALERLARGSAG